MPSLTCTRVAVISIAAVLLQAAGLSLFVIGFFPVKSALSGVSGTESFSFPSCNSTSEGSQKTQWTPPDRLRSIYEELSQIPASFDRLILMVVDGLPAEFVLGRGDLPPKRTLMDAMPYTQSLLSSGRAMGFHAKAAPPTVTMPRLKAMVSGAIGGFLDVAFNFNTQALLDDNLLGQFDNIGWKMVMFGDETWIKLFPRLFTRHDGVSSFFVKDTVEVDHNVSRHLEVELVSDDWNLLILHYLGLDHIGHIGGRHSILMPQKMKEMDEVIKIIHMNTILHKGLDRKRTLLVVTSDHGMTDSGNHGGSSYEETDSLALFIGLGPKTADYAFTTQNTAFQVDITPTLALLFGVPIPKNSVGVFIPGVLDSMTEEQQFRAKELNSWQLVRLLQEQLPGLLCESSSCKGVNLEQDFESTRCRTGAEKLCCLFFKAVALHNSWKSQRVASPMSNCTDDLHRTIVAYDEFLRSAAEWLSRRVTDKPLDVLASGIFVMLLSSTMLISLVFWLSKQVGLTHFKSLSNSSVTHKWHLDEAFALAAVVIHLLSLCASSMVEEEQYIWHFLTSTLFFMFLITSIQSCHAGTSGRYLEIFCIFVVLICGRILRGWHQGGVNWTYLHDISKWLENAGSARISALQIASVLFTTGLGFLVLYQVSSMKFLVSLVQVSVLISGFLVVLYITESSNYSGTLIAQTIFLTLGVTAIGTTLASPWIISVSRFQALKTEHSSSPSIDMQIDMQIEHFLMGLRDLSYLIGWTLVICWCFLQLLVQQSVNACPVFLMLLQILASMKYFSTAGSHHKSWVQVAGLYFLGMAGHFGLGNSNSLATIDVAGAFIGISSHSTVISGILLFIITYASPLLFLIGLVIYVPAKEMQYRLDSKCADLGYYLQIKIGIPSLVPLAMNSVVLTTFTIILLLMRNHLFVWSVFSPKYLYVVAATVSVTIGVSVMAATGAYSCLVFFFRTKMFYSKMGPYLSHQ